MKILHIADRHGRDKDIDEIRKCDDFVIRTAIEEKPDVVTFAGDMFDSQDIQMKSPSGLLAMQTVSRLADVAPVVVITGTSKHDGSAPEILRYARGKFPVHVSSYPEQIFLYQGSFYETTLGNIEPDATLTLIPALTKQFFKTSSGIADADQEIAQQMSGLFLGFGAACGQYKAPHILLWHGGVSGAKIPSGHVLTGQDIEISTDQIRMAGNGHDFLGCYYPGPVYPVKVDEQECGFWVHELNERDFVACLGHIHQKQQIGGDKSWASKWVEIPVVKTARYKVDETTDPPQIMDTDEMGDVTGKAVRIEITTWQDQVNGIFKDHIIDQLMNDQGALSVDIRINAVPRQNIRAEAVLKADRLRDKIRARAELNGDELSPEVYDMADLLEDTEAEKMMAMVAGGAA